ncbi:MAG: reverse transcriptase-like protein [Candidatus Coatesbacteria bacterium]|nr:reverse transcriptase-like protein [Candidatus Coatesbacteria bacterium]
MKSLDQETTLAKKARYIGETTSNVAEYTAILDALKQAHKRGVKKVLVRSDSELVVKQLKGENKIKDPKLLRLFTACQSEIDEFAVFGIEHIPRAENAEADKMVQDAIKAQKKTQTTEPGARGQCRFKPDGTIYVAGSAKGSPGHAAAAYVIFTQDDKVAATHVRYLGKRLPDVPEYAAVYLSAKKALALGLKKVVIRSDNTLVAKQLSGEFKVKSEKLKTPYAESMQALRGLEEYAIQIVPREANKTAHAMVSETIKCYLKQEAENKNGNQASSALVRDSELDS